MGIRRSRKAGDCSDRRPAFGQCLRLGAAIGVGAFATGAGSVFADIPDPGAQPSNEVATTIAEAYPPAVAPPEATPTDANPAVFSSTESGFESMGTPNKSWTGKSFGHGIGVETLSGDLELVPLGGSTAAAEPVANSAAITFAGTNNDADSVVRATDEGFEIFESITGPGAPESFRYRVDLTGDEYLRGDGQGAIEVVDPTPNLERPPAPEPLPATQASVDALNASPNLDPPITHP